MHISIPLMYITSLPMHISIPPMYITSPPMHISIPLMYITSPPMHITIPLMYITTPPMSCIVTRDCAKNCVKRTNTSQNCVRIEMYFNYIIWEKLNSFVANHSIISFVFSLIVCFRREKSLYSVTVKILLSFQQAISDCIVQSHTFTLKKPRYVRHLYFIKKQGEGLLNSACFSQLFDG